MPTLDELLSRLDAAEDARQSHHERLDALLDDLDEAVAQFDPPAETSSGEPALPPLPEIAGADRQLAETVARRLEGRSAQSPEIAARLDEVLRRLATAERLLRARAGEPVFR